MTLLLALLLTVPILTGLVLVTAAPRATGAIVVAAGLVAAAVTTVVAVQLAAGPHTATLRIPLVPPPIDLAFVYAVDDLGAALVVTVAAVGALVLLAAAGEPRLRRGRFVGTVLVFLGAMLATVTAATLPALIAPWEVMGAASWALIAFDRRDPAVAPAATRAFLTTRVADVGLYVAAGAALAAGVPGLALTGLAGASPAWSTLIAAGLVVAALGKSAQLPFSVWLSGAMVGPSPVSALLHSATMVAAGAVLLIRAAPLLAVTGAASVVALVGALTAVVLGLVAACSRDLKQLLAASTCSQVGIMVLGAGVGAISGAAGLLVSHAAVKALLFLVAGGWLAVLRTRSLPALRGAARRHPVLGVTFTVGAAALAGVPPLSLWWTKDAVLTGVPLGSQDLRIGGVLTVAGLFATVLSAVAATRAAWFVWRPVRSPSIRREHRRRVPAVLVAALVVLAVPAAGLGALLVGVGLVPRADAGELVTTGIVVVFAASATWVLHSQPPRLRAAVWGRAAGAARGWFGMETATRVVVVTPVLALARLLDRADAGLGRAVPRAAGTVPVLAAALERRGERPISTAVTGLAAGVRRLGALARRPQTGQAHQYYAQSMIAVGTLAAVAAVVVMAGVRP